MKKVILFLLAPLCLILAFSVAGWAQTNASATAGGTGKISGILLDSLSGKPVEFATVALLQQGSKQSIGGTLTDNKGQFSFSGLKEGNYELAFSFIGFKTKTIPQLAVTESKPDVVLGSIKLSPVATQLKEVDVQTMRPTIVQEADRLVINVEGTAMAAGSSAYDVVSKAPGVFMDEDGNVRLNGKAGVTVMLDNKLTYLSARDLRTLLEGMSAENIKNIEIITNPSAKYDAEGSSGILNINLKKNAQQGINGSLYAGYRYNGKQHAYSAGGNINYKKGHWNSFLMLDAARRVGGREATFTRVFKGDEETTYFDQVATGNYEVQGPPAIRLGTDYSFNEQHSIGFMVNYTTNDLSSDFLTDTYIGPAPNAPVVYINADNYNTNRFQNFTSNLHYVNKLDTAGTMLSADLDFVQIRNDGEANFYNYYDSLLVDQPIRQDFLYTSTPNGFDIFSAKVDYARALSRGRKLDFGAKASRVISDNDSRFFFNNSEAPVLDPERTIYFVYDENIFAGYVNWKSKLGKKFSLQAGLRAEQTVSNGERRLTGEVKKYNYFDLFPSLFVQQKVNDNYEISYTYSRRLQRPNYGNLNPFIFYRDPYTYIQGNPDLRPEYTNSFGITQTFKKTYSLALEYQHTRDVIAELPAVDQETTTTIYYTGNLDESRDLSLTAVAPFKMMKNWDTNNTLVLSYNEYSGMASGQEVINDQLYYMLQSNHMVLLPKDFKLEVNFSYQGPAVYALYRIEPQFWVNLGLKKSFLDDKFDLSLNANDLFKGQRLIIAANVGEGNTSEFNQYFRTRNIGLTLRYHFSKGQKINENQRERNLEELRRTGN